MTERKPPKRPVNLTRPMCVACRAPITWEPVMATIAYHNGPSGYFEMVEPFCCSFCAQWLQHVVDDDGETCVAVHTAKCCACGT